MKSIRKGYKVWARAHICTHGNSTRDWREMRTGANGSKREYINLACQASGRVRQCLREDDCIVGIHWYY